MSAGRVRVLIVEDHPIFRKGLISLLELEPQFQVVGEATTRHAAVAGVGTLAPDVVLMDLALGVESGLDAIKDILYQRPGTRILVLSMHEEEVYRQRSVNSGALGFCHKRAPVQTLLQAIRTVADGLVWQGESSRESPEPGAPAPPLTDSLTDRELDVFRLVGAGLGTQEIAEALHVSVKTVDTHKGNLRTKLGCPGAAELRKLAVAWSLRERRL